MWKWLQQMVFVIMMIIIIGIITAFIIRIAKKDEEKGVVKITIIDDSGKEGRNWIVEYDTIKFAYGKVVFTIEGNKLVCLDKYIIEDMEK